MIAEVVTIGDEVCRGEIVDSNSAFLAASLWNLDVTTAFLSSCRDDARDMAETLIRAAGRANLVLVTGGLGPTLDDLTVDVMSELCGTEPVIEPGAKARMDQRIATARYVAANMDRQVRVPRGAQVHENRVGLAPAFEVELEGTPVICLPGPPRELIPIFEDHLAARIVELREARGEEVERIARRIYRIFGRGESQVAELVEGLIDGIDGASLHFQVKYPEVLVKVVVRARDQEIADRHLAGIDADVRSRLGDYLYGVDEQTLPALLGETLAAAGLTLATAESCTGGLIGALITEVPGSSRYYLGGSVTYADAEKVRQLGVSSQTLGEHGAVSEACVREMAAGVRERSGADIGVAVSGVAGPGGGSEEKPLGTVWLAVSGPGDASETRRLHWPSSREQVRKLAAHAALAMVIRRAR